MQSLENSLHCFLVTFLYVTNLSLHILAKDCLLIRHLAIADKIKYQINSCFMLAYHLSQWFSTFLLLGSLPQILALLMEPYAMIQVSTLLSVINLWNSWIVLVQPHRTVGCKFCPGQFQPVLVEPLAAICGSLRFRGTSGKKDWS